MAPIQETGLAGIGRKFTIETHTKERLIIVVHDSGTVELYHTPSKDLDKAEPVATLDSDEARQVAGIIGRTLYRPEAIERLTRQGVEISWHRLVGQAYAIGKTIGELQISPRTGASIIATLEKDGTKYTNPEESYVLKEGSQVALSGTSKEIQACINLLEGGV